MTLGQLVIEPSALDLGLGNATACLISAPAPFTSEALLDLAVELPPIGERDGYSEILAKLGYPEVEPAGQRLVRLAAERGLRSYGLLVDACNVVAARHAAGIGIHDVGDRLATRDLVVRRAEPGLTIVPAFSTSTKKIPAGDLVYGLSGADGFEPLAWLGKRDTDSATGQISPGTSSALLVVLGHAGLSRSDTQAMADEIVALISAHTPSTHAVIL